MDASGTLIERSATSSGALPHPQRRNDIGMDGLASVLEKGGLGVLGEHAEVSRNIAQVLTLHGIDADAAASSIALTGQQPQQYMAGRGSSRRSYPSSATTNPSPPHISSTRAQQGIEQLTFTSSYATWAATAPCKVYSSHFAVNGYQRSASLISNGQTVLPSLQRPLLNGSNMFRSGAYVHQYLSCGLETDDFVSSFRSLGQIVNNYKAL